MGFVACFLLYSYTRRFSQLRFSSEMGVVLSRFPLRRGGRPRSTLLRPCPGFIALCSLSSRIGFSSVGSFVGPFRLPGWASCFPCRARCRYQPRRGRGVSRSHGVFALRYLYAPFFLAHFPIGFLLRLSRGGIRANRLTGYRGRVVSYGISRGTQLATPRGHETQ